MKIEFHTDFREKTTISPFFFFPSFQMTYMTIHRKANIGFVAHIKSSLLLHVNRLTNRLRF
jgi:hypothetical protein